MKVILAAFKETNESQDFIANTVFGLLKRDGKGKVFTVRDIQLLRLKAWYPLLKLKTKTKVKLGAVFTTDIG